MGSDGRQGGFIKLWRRIESWSLFESMTGDQRLVVFALLLGANWKPSTVWLGNLRVEIGRGEWLVSEEALARRAKVSRKVVRVAIAKLMAEGFLSAREVGQRVGSEWAEKGPASGPGTGPEMGPAARVLIVNNFERYQGDTDEEGPEMGQRRDGERAKEGPAEGQPRAPSKEGEEGKKKEETAPGFAPAPLSKPSLEAPPTAELSLLGVSAALPAPGPAAAAVKLVAAAGTPKPRDPLRRELSDALVAVGREERGGSFAFDGAKDGQGITRLLGWSRNVSDHARRFRAALRAPAVEYGYRVDTISAFATGRVWNHFAGSATSTAPTRLAPLGRPG